MHEMKKVVAVKVDKRIQMRPRADIGDADILTYWVREVEHYVVFRKGGKGQDIIMDKREYVDFADLAGEVLMDVL